MTEIGEIPSEWQVRKLGEITIGKGEYGIGASATEYIEGKPRYLRITDIGDSCRLLFNEIKGLDDADYEKYILKEGDIVFARTGNTTGKGYVYNREHGELVYAGFLIKYSIDNNIAKHNFIKYVIQSKRYWDWVNIMSTRSGQPGINSNEYSSFIVQLPPLKEQEKIASILSTVDEQIDNVDALIEKNKELKKGLMQTLLTKGIGHTKFKKTQIGEIPEEWEVINAGRVFNIITDYVANGSFASLAENVKYKESEDFAIVVRLTDYKNEYKGPFVYVDKNAYDFLSKSKLEDNDIIIANVGAYAGYVFRAPNINKPITLGPNAILVRSEQNREFIYYLLSSEFGQKAIKDIISTTAQPKFNKTDFKKILLPIPDLKEQYKIASILLEIDEKTEEYEKKKQKLEELKKGLMQQLLTGRIRV